jgi:diadenosine tetraphosphate (Ap4A) HIT family hydrolase
MIPDPTAGGRSSADCLLCPRLRFWFNEMADLPGPETVLWKDSDAYIAPDLAPVAEGHLLVVTDRHYECVGACPPELWGSVLAATDRVAAMYRAVYGTPAVFFEHGPARPGAAGSCIDHTHLHCLPATAALRPALDSAGLTGEPATFDTLKALWDAGESYLYLDEAGSQVAYRAEELPSQFLRRAAGRVFGPEGPASPWRWQECCGAQASRRRFLRTVERLGPAPGVDHGFLAASHQ